MSTKNLHFTGWRESKIQGVQAHSLGPSEDEVWCHPKANTKKDGLLPPGFRDKLSHIGCGLAG